VKYTIDENTKDITETIAGSFSQYPLKTAWAITIHKSQGLTFEHAIIDASAAFSHGQVYVALSRCKTLEGMVLSSPITRNAMISDEKILSYTSSLSERQPCEDQLRQAQQQYYLRLATELFDFNPVQQKLQYTSYAAYTHLVDLYIGSLYQREAIGLDLFQKVSATFSDAVLYMLVRIIEIRAGWKRSRPIASL